MFFVIITRKLIYYIFIRKIQNVIYIKLGYGCYAYLNELYVIIMKRVYL